MQSTSSTGDGERGADYADKDLPGGAVDPGPGAYTNQQTPGEARGEDPDLRGHDDAGEYTDSDHVNEGRPAPVQGGYTSTDETTATADDE